MGSLDKLVNNMLRRRLVRVAHAKVKDAFPAPARIHLQLCCDVKDIRRQSFYSVKFFQSNLQNTVMRVRDALYVKDLCFFTHTYNVHVSRSFPHYTNSSQKARNKHASAQSLFRTV